MSGKHKRRARRAAQFAAWARKKAEKAPTPEKQRFYEDAAQWGENSRKQAERDDRKEGA